MTYGTAYVAQIALARRTRKPSKPSRKPSPIPAPRCIIAYCPCIEHGYELGWGWTSKNWRWTPASGRSTGSIRGACAAGEPGLKLDSAAPKVPLEKFWASERRFQAMSQPGPGQQQSHSGRRASGGHQQIRPLRKDGCADQRLRQARPGEVNLCRGILQGS